MVCLLFNKLNLKNNNMKKQLIYLSTAIVFAIASCNNGENSASMNTEDSTSTTTQLLQLPAILMVRCKLLPTWI